MTNFFKFGFFILIAIAILTFVFKGQNSSDKLYIEGLKSERDALKESNINLQDNIDSVALELVVIKDSFNIEKLAVIESENKRHSATKYYEEKIKSRDNLVVNEINKIFEKRFNDSPFKVDNDSIITIPKWMAIETTKGFDMLDLADTTIKLLEIDIVSYKSQIQLQERLVSGLEKQNEYLKEVNLNNAEIIALGSKEVEHWKRQSRKQKRQKFIVGGIGVALIIFILR